MSCKGILGGRNNTCQDEGALSRGGHRVVRMSGAGSAEPRAVRNQGGGGQDHHTPEAFYRRADYLGDRGKPPGPVWTLEEMA